MAPTSPARPVHEHEVLAVVLQVRDGRLAVLLWWRAFPPDAGRWSLPGGVLEESEGLGPSIRRQLAAKVDIRELSHLEQLNCRGEPDRVPGRRVLATSYLGLVPGSTDPALPADTSWRWVDELPRMAFDHEEIVRSGVERLRSKLSYTNLGFALAPPTFTLSELTGYYRAALGHEVDATNLQRILVRRHQIEATGGDGPLRSGRGPARGHLPVPRGQARDHRRFRRPASAASGHGKWRGKS